MDEFQYKFLKIHSQYNVLDSNRQRDMSAIDDYMNMILDLFSEEITWDKLHVTDRNSQIYILEKLIKQVKHITVESNKKSNKVDKVTLR